MSGQTMNRRSFLRQAASGLAAGAMVPTLVDSKSLGFDGGVAPSERIALGFIGTGEQGRFLVKQFFSEPCAQIVSICDVDSRKRSRAVEMCEDFYGPGCEGTGDFRELLGRGDVDAVVIATPDHWHAVQSICAMRAGKDVYCEKPLALTISEGREMVRTARQYGRVFQVGSMQRSHEQFRRACELVRNGYIGEIKNIRVDLNFSEGGRFRLFSVDCDLGSESVPDYLDWESWLGPAPWRPYHPILSPPVEVEEFPQWRNYVDYSGGLMTDWGAHHFDIVQWALGMDESGPVRIFPPSERGRKDVSYVYGNGVRMVQEKLSRGTGVLFEGSEGEIWVSRGELETLPESLARKRIGSNEVRLYESRNHYDNWLGCIRDRARPICDVEIGHRSATVCHLGNIAYRLNRAIEWDPEKERFVADDQASRMLSHAKRSGWRL